MHASLIQLVGSESRTFTLHDDGIEVDARGRRTHSSKRFMFQQFGQQKTDFDITQKHVLRYNQRQRIIMNVAAAGLAFVCFGISNQLEKTAGHMSLAAIVTVCLGWAFVAAALAVLVLQARPICCKRVYFEGGSLEFFFRNQQDGDQIDAFLDAYARAESAYARDYFLTELAKDPKGMQRWLDTLANRGLFTADEYAQHLVTIQAAEGTHEPA